MLILYLAVLIIGTYWVVRTLGPEMAKPPLPAVKYDLKSKPVKPAAMATTELSIGRVERLEILLAEKDRNIALLQNDLRVLQVQASSFDKLRKILDDENQRLKEQNRMLRSELGLPAAGSRERSVG